MIDTSRCFSCGKEQQRLGRSACEKFVLAAVHKDSSNTTKLPDACCKHFNEEMLKFELVFSEFSYYVCCPSYFTDDITRSDEPAGVSCV